MKNLIRKITLLVSICSVSICFGQQQPQYTQYMYNPMELNAGYTGSKGILEATLTHRSQWVGMKGAPVNQAVSVQGLLAKRFGLGLMATNDNIGPSNETNVQGTFAYHLGLSFNTKLSFGVNAGANFMSIDWTKGTFYTPNDASFAFNNRIRPILGSGLFIYNEKWYGGLSVPNFLRGDFYSDEMEALVERDFHYYFMGGYVLALTENVKLKPAFLVKYVKGAPLTTDVSASFLFKEKFTAGIGYRYHDAVNFLLGYQIAKSFFVGYSYDATLTKIRNYSSGSHEIILRYGRVRKDAILRSPRFF